jgi:hypothetical protein
LFCRALQKDKSKFGCQQNVGMKKGLTQEKEILLKIQMQICKGTLQLAF